MLGTGVGRVLETQAHGASVKAIASGARNMAA